jgi:homoserine kinase
LASQVAFNTNSQWITQRINIPNGLQCVLFIPDGEMATNEARAVLPKELPYEDAIFNISRAAMLVNCFATAQFNPLRYAMEVPHGWRWWLGGEMGVTMRGCWLHGR